MEKKEKLKEIIACLRYYDIASIIIENDVTYIRYKNDYIEVIK